MIHASADFEFVQLLRYSPGFDGVVRAALGKQPCTIVTDTEMVREGIRTMCRGTAQPTCLLNDPATQPLAQQHALTRSAAGIRIAAQRH
ncbi:precorrin-8X methylmutase, partial [Escherichia coli]|nr:precorrin-8X methylmutase [Escherichia coli]